ncbi:MAG: phosphoadenosine phosphosulfate reductase family protein [Chloroflexi bacterium]|nr:phosphoadenosine phosphosulfate reductase family protein [Chloroflexota bacterium]MBU1750420.1 phosphoadenosine phosphosulfate reductase family protein [Chloroflexota bacterium]
MDLPSPRDFSFAVVSLSGGKDSAAALHYTLSAWPRERVLAHWQVVPEEWVAPSLAYNARLCRQLGVPLVAEQIVYRAEPSRRAANPDVGTTFDHVRAITRPSDVLTATPPYIGGVVDLALRRGAPPTNAIRWCTQYHKERLLDYRLRQWWRVERVPGLTGALGPCPVVILGLRALESPGRAKRPAVTCRWRHKRQGFTVTNWNPIFDWSRREVLGYLERHGLDLHPCYEWLGLARAQWAAPEERGPRCSCIVCLYAQPEHLVRAARRPEAHAVLRRVTEFEAATGKTWSQRFSVTQLLEGR